MQKVEERVRESHEQWIQFTKRNSLLLMSTRQSAARPFFCAYVVKSRSSSAVGKRSRMRGGIASEQLRKRGSRESATDAGKKVASFVERVGVHRWLL